MTTDTYNMSSLAQRDLIVRMNDETFRKLLPTVCVCGILSLLGVVGNTLSIFVFATRMSRHLQNDLFILLSVVNFLACAVCLPLEVVDIRFMYMYPSETVCKIARFLNSWAMTLSVMTLITLALLRLRAATSSKVITSQTSHSLLGILGLLVGSVMVAWLALVVFGIRSAPTFIRDVTGEDCSVSDHIAASAWPVVFNVIFTLGLVVLLLVTCGAYYKIWRVVKKSRLAVQAHTEVTIHVRPPDNVSNANLDPNATMVQSDRNNSTMPGRTSENEANAVNLRHGSKDNSVKLTVKPWEKMKMSFKKGAFVKCGQFYKPKNDNQDSKSLPYKQDTVDPTDEKNTGITTDTYKNYQDSKNHCLTSEEGDITKPGSNLTGGSPSARDGKIFHIRNKDFNVSQDITKYKSATLSDTNIFTMTNKSSIASDADSGRESPVNVKFIKEDLPVLLEVVSISSAHDINADMDQYCWETSPSVGLTKDSSLCPISDATSQKADKGVPHVQTPAEEFANRTCLTTTPFDKKNNITAPSHNDSHSETSLSTDKNKKNSSLENSGNGKNSSLNVSDRSKNSSLYSRHKNKNFSLNRPTDDSNTISDLYISGNNNNSGLPNGALNKNLSPSSNSTGTTSSIQLKTKLGTPDYKTESSTVNPSIYNVNVIEGKKSVLDVWSNTRGAPSLPINDKGYLTSSQNVGPQITASPESYILGKGQGHAIDNESNVVTNNDSEFIINCGHPESEQICSNEQFFQTSSNTDNVFQIDTGNSKTLQFQRTKSDHSMSQNGDLVTMVESDISERKQQVTNESNKTNSNQDNVEIDMENFVGPQNLRGKKSDQKIDSHSQSRDAIESLTSDTPSQAAVCPMTQRLRTFVEKRVLPLNVFKEKFTKNSNNKTTGGKFVGQKIARNTLETAVTRTAFLLTFTFIISYVPFFIISISRTIIADFDYSQDAVKLNLINIAIRLYFVTPTVSPAIFWASNLDFRRKCRSLWYKNSSYPAS